MAVPEQLRTQTEAAIDGAFQVSVTALFKVLELALIASEDDQDREVAEERFEHGLDAAADARARARRIAGLD